MTRKVRLGIVGARGYTGRELLRLLSRHSSVELAFVTSRELGGIYEDLTPEECALRAPDAVVLALPNDRSAPYVAAIDAALPGAVVVDLSADHRFDDAWTYGRPETQRARISKAKRIANPGCFATALLLAAAPWAHIVEGPMHAFGVSGYSGAGTTPSPRNDPAVLEDNLLPYSLVDHTHEQEVSRQLGTVVRLLPHVAPFFRGITVTLSVRLARRYERQELHLLQEEKYREERLVRVSQDPPLVRDIRERHETTIGGVSVSRDGRHAAVVACVDNLLGGAATTAIRNVNLALGLPELAGIEPWLA